MTGETPEGSQEDDDDPPYSMMGGPAGIFSLPPEDFGLAQYESDIHAVRNQAIDELMAQNDRGAAILGGSYVEEGLRAFLVACWRGDEDRREGKRPNPAVVREKLLDYPGPLATFSAKIDVAYMSRLIGPFTWRDLDIIRDVRNDFAHKMTMDRKGLRHEIVAFDHPSVAHRCERLWNGAKIRITHRDGRVFEANTPRNRYTLAAILHGQTFYNSAWYLHQGWFTLEEATSHFP